MGGKEFGISLNPGSSGRKGGAFVARETKMCTAKKPDDMFSLFALTTTYPKGPFKNMPNKLMGKQLYYESQENFFAPLLKFSHGWLFFFTRSSVHSSAP